MLSEALCFVPLPRAWRTRAEGARTETPNGPEEEWGSPKGQLCDPLTPLGSTSSPPTLYQPCTTW